MKQLRAALVAVLGISVPAIALAQPKGKDKEAPEGVKPPADGDGEEVPLDEDPPPDDIEGTAENPDAPRLPGQDEPTDVVAPPEKRTGYPIEEVLRPLTLPAVTSEVGLDARSTFKNMNGAFGVRARYGVTRQWQLGVRYLIGGAFDDNPDDMDDAVSFSTGKAVGLDLSYLVFDWVAARVTVPMYVDPFAMSINLGAPMKFRFGDKLAITALDDFIEIRVIEFVPSLYDERENSVNADLVETNPTKTNANLHFRGGIIYQLQPDMAIKGNFVQSFRDTSDNDQPTGLEGLIQYSPSPDLDVIGRAGFDRLDSPSDSFGLMIAGQYRI
jgi:hypothetical protein